jgi:hypothetical protein
MENISINGTIETIGNDRDIVDIIRNIGGDDFASFVEQRLYRPLEISQELREQIISESDYYSYEASLDSHNCVFNDVLEECENQIEYIKEGKRIDKNKLLESFEKIAEIIQSEI